MSTGDGVPEQSVRPFSGPQQDRRTTAGTRMEVVMNARALSHPIRVRLLVALGDREASPKQLAEETGISLSLVSYHVGLLQGLEVLELVREVPRRGAIEHFYRAGDAGLVARVVEALS